MPLTFIFAATEKVLEAPGQRQFQHPNPTEGELKLNQNSNAMFHLSAEDRASVITDLRLAWAT